MVDLKIKLPEGFLEPEERRTVSKDQPSTELDLFWKSPVKEKNKEVRESRKQTVFPVSIV